METTTTVGALPLFQKYLSTVNEDLKNDFLSDGTPLRNEKTKAYKYSKKQRGILDKWKSEKKQNDNDTNEGYNEMKSYLVSFNSLVKKSIDKLSDIQLANIKAELKSSEELISSSLIKIADKKKIVERKETEKKIKKLEDELLILKEKIK